MFTGRLTAYLCGKVAPSSRQVSTSSASVKVIRAARIFSPICRRPLCFFDRSEGVARENLDGEALSRLALEGISRITGSSLASVKFVVEAYVLSGCSE